jgi:hypothetical protein
LRRKPSASNKAMPLSSGAASSGQNSVAVTEAVTPSR